MDTTSDPLVGGKNLKTKTSLEYTNLKIIQIKEYNYFHSGLNLQK